MKFEFCLPTLGKTVPAGSEWFHEIKYDLLNLLGRSLTSGNLLCKIVRLIQSSDRGQPLRHQHRADFS